MKWEGPFWASRKDRISLPVPYEPRSQGREPLALGNKGLVRGSTFGAKGN